MNPTQFALSAFVAALLLVVGLAASSYAEQTRTVPPATPAYTGPIVDAHLHAYPVNYRGPAPTAVCVGQAAELAATVQASWSSWYVDMVKHPKCASPIWSPASDTELRDQTIAEMRRLNITGVVSGPPALVREYVQQLSGRVIPAIEFNFREYHYLEADIVRMLDFEGFRVLGEITDQYDGIAPDDPKFDPYWKIAEDRGVPVAIHLGIGPPAAPFLTPQYHARQISPFALERVLTRFPRLRIQVMHAAWPMRDELKAMLYHYPQMYIDTGSLQFALTRAEYYSFLKEIVDAGFTDRILFGSDQQVWPGLIEEGINAINDAEFLTHLQKAAILHDNAVRFFRLSEHGESRQPTVR